MPANARSNTAITTKNRGYFLKYFIGIFLSAINYMGLSGFTVKVKSNFKILGFVGSVLTFE